MNTTDETRTYLRNALVNDRTFTANAELSYADEVDAYDLPISAVYNAPITNLRVCYLHADQQIKVLEFDRQGLVNETTFSLPDNPTVLRIAQVLAVIDLHLAN